MPPQVGKAEGRHRPICQQNTDGVEVRTNESGKKPKVTRNDVVAKDAAAPHRDIAKEASSKKAELGAMEAGILRNISQTRLEITKSFARVARGDGMAPVAEASSKTQNEDTNAKRNETIKKYVPDSTTKTRQEELPPEGLERAKYYARNTRG